MGGWAGELVRKAKCSRGYPIGSNPSTYVRCNPFQPLEGLLGFYRRFDSLSYREIVGILRSFIYIYIASILNMHGGYVSHINVLNWGFFLMVFVELNSF